MIGRLHIQAEIEKPLPGRVLSLSVGPKRDDFTRYLRVRLGKDETSDSMDESPEADILDKIPENLSEVGVGIMVLRTSPPHYRLIGICRFLLVSLNIVAILQESTIYRRRKRLHKITDGSH